MNVDQANIVLMISSCIAAFILPFELVLASYAFLGPAHYLTQISWMHDRGYFTGQKWLMVPAILLTGLLIIAIKNPDFGGNTSIFVLYAAALAGAMALALLQKPIQQAALAGTVFAALLAVKGIFPEFLLGFIILLPTVIHIYVFTGSFILIGAIKSKSFWGVASFAVFIACAAAFFFITPPDTILAPAFVANSIGMFEDVAGYLAELMSFNGWVDGHAMLGFLAFAYTYHYLNWFSKVEIIKWHDMPKQRLVIIAALYVASIGIYLYDYTLGLTALLFLSILHVILEFPLNVITFKGLGQSALSFIPNKSS